MIPGPVRALALLHFWIQLRATEREAATARQRTEQRPWAAVRLRGKTKSHMGDIYLDFTYEIKDTEAERRNMRLLVFL